MVEGKAGTRDPGADPYFPRVSGSVSDDPVFVVTSQNIAAGNNRNDSMWHLNLEIDQHPQGRPADKEEEAEPRGPGGGTQASERLGRRSP